MAEYMIKTGLWETPVKEYDNDRDAWNNLRSYVPNKFGCLYKWIRVEITVNNEEEYVRCHNAKYGPPPVGHGPADAEMMVVGKKNYSGTWMPVLKGITSDEYNVTEKVGK